MSGVPVEGKRLTLNLDAKGLADLEAVMTAVKVGQTPAIHRALALAAFVEQVEARGGALLIREEGVVSRLKLL